MTEQPKDGGPPMTDPNLTAPDAVARHVRELRRVAKIHAGNSMGVKGGDERLAADMLEAFAALVAELEARNAELAMQSLADLGQAQEAYEAQKAAEAQLAALDRMLQEARRDEREKALREAVEAFANSNNLSRPICCNGHHCGCMGATAEDYVLHVLNQLIQEPPR